MIGRHCAVAVGCGHVGRALLTLGVDLANLGVVDGGDNEADAGALEVLTGFVEGILHVVRAEEEELIGLPLLAAALIEAGQGHLDSEPLVASVPADDLGEVAFGDGLDLERARAHIGHDADEPCLGFGVRVGVQQELVSRLFFGAVGTMAGVFDDAGKPITGHGFREFSMQFRTSCATRSASMPSSNGTWQGAAPVQAAWKCVSSSAMAFASPMVG